ncbi:hypothetical protein LR48_Vigan02g165200 [Vigna angularis]|uniref:Uncharacterized protein n=1 Tax=Phaseolus angularis TaxID=3914 RepID=A0A0L9TYP3_PHAAN|nr:hypothetical protein LR48_Vigan02g165200 [Vigna angularis]
MDREVNEPGTVRVRHRVQTQPIVELNASLSSFHKEKGGIEKELTRLWYDCGILVIKYIELWDHTPKFDGKKMPDYTMEQLQVLREQMVCQWILHEDNVHRTRVLQKCGMGSFRH